MSLNNRHITVAGLMSLFVTIATITIFLHYLDLHAAEISTVSIVLLVVGLAGGSLIPSILTTWLIILLSVLGIAILLLGTVPISLSSKLMLLAVFPVGAGLTSINRYVLLRSGWGKSNRRDIERYAFHYNPVTKLQQTHNAEKMYQKTVRFIQNDPDATLWFNITAIHWANNTQFKQFHAAEYDKVLRKIAKVLKDYRLPSESLYYLGRGTFLIISHHLSADDYAKRNRFTEEHLNEIALLGTTPQFKWGSLKVDHSNADRFPALEDATNYLQRKMETNLVVEYLKGEES